MKKINWLVTDQNVTVNYDGKTYIVSRKETLANNLINALKNKKFDEIPELVSAAKRIEKQSNGQFTVVNGNVVINGVAASPVISNKILKFSNEGLPFEPLVKFADKIQKNPSFRAVNELFTFLEKNDHPITESGNFIAYKRVKEDFTDIYSGTFDNSVGNVVEIERNKVDEDPNRTCSHGLHVANWNYAHTQFSSSNSESDIMLEVEVDPADVVAVPNDYNNSKMRVCKYIVLGVVDSENSSDVSLKYTNTDTVSETDCCDDVVCEDNGCEYCEEDADEYPFEDEFEE